MLRTRLLHVLGLILVAAVIALGVTALSALRIRADLTDGRLYTLSSGTRQVLRELDRDVTLKFYYSRGNRDLPTPLKVYASRVEDLLREYDRLGGRRVDLELHNPTPLSDEEEWAQKYGLRPLNLPIPGADPIYFGIVGVSGSRESALAALSPEDEPQLEYQLTRLLYEITRDEKPALHIMTGLPIMGGPPPGMPMFQQAPPEPPWMIVEQLRHFYELHEVEPDAEAIPGEADTLMVVHPTGFPESALYAIDQFLLRGGRLIAFVDPLNIIEAQRQGGNPMAMMGGGGRTASNLNRLTGAWGITLRDGQVVADLAAATTLGGRDGQPESNPTFLTLRSEHLNQDEVVTADLDFLLVPFPGAFQGEPAEGLRQTVLLSTSDRAGFVGAMEAQFGVAARSRIPIEEKPLPLAVRLQGRFPSAFPDGPPQPRPDPYAEDEEDEDEPEGPPPGHLAAATRSGVAVLVADTDLLFDAFAVREQRFFGQRVVELISDNYNLVLNLLEQLTGSEALIGLRSRGTFNRPFTRVQEIETRAQAAFREELEALQEREREARQRLEDLQRQADPDQRMFVTPAQEETIRQYREELFQTERRIRDLQRELRRDVDRLGLWVKGINIALVPGLVALFGLGHGLLRRRR